MGGAEGGGWRTPQPWLVGNTQRSTPEIRLFQPGNDEVHQLWPGNGLLEVIPPIDEDFCETSARFLPGFVDADEIAGGTYSRVRPGPHRPAPAYGRRGGGQ